MGGAHPPEWGLKSYRQRERGREGERTDLNCKEERSVSWPGDKMKMY